MTFFFLFIAFTISLLVALLTTPFVRVLAVKFRIVDRPDNRKIHTTETPYLGGVAIFIGVMTTYLIFGQLTTIRLLLLSVV